MKFTLELSIIGPINNRIFTTLNPPYDVELANGDEQATND